MKHLGRIQKLCLAGWLLGAAVLVGVNLFSFVSLEKASLEGEPANLRALRSQLSLLESLTAANARHLTDMAALQGFFAAYHTPKRSAEIPAPAPAAGAVSEAGEAAALPGLAGVMQRIDGRGVPYYLALLDGRVCAEKDAVGMFTVGPITAEGVVLQRAGMRWFLPSPQPYYSSDQGR